MTDNDPYYSAYKKNILLLRKLTTEEITELGKNIGIEEEVLQEPSLVAEIAAEMITDFPGLGRFIPKKYFDGSE